MKVERKLAPSGLVVAIAIVLLALATALSAGADPGPGRGDWFVTLNAAHFETARDYDFGYASGGGISLGLAAKDNLAAEVSYNEWSADRGDGRSRWITAIWSSKKTKRGIRPYLLAGGGNSTHVPDSDWPSGRCGQRFVGAGVFGAVGSRIHWRGDVRGVSTSGSGGFSPYFQLGLTVSFGRTRPAPARVPPPARPAPPEPAEVEPKCPGTPPGIPVDADGCPLDGDDDGVPDYKDRCPDTPAGARVDPNGCPIASKVSVEFDFDSVELRPENGQRLLPFVRYLDTYPSRRASLDGHTDHEGSTAYNQRLSERRVEAVRDHLVGAGVATERLSVNAHGESQPIADNATEDGRQRNRRVTATAEDPDR